MAETARPKILFVDDDPNILQGLRRMLFFMRNDWEMNFVEGGEKALSFLKDKPVDILVSDMKMPGMDGIQLLTEVKEKYPQIIRIILSGYSDYQMILNSVPLVHQYINKPCEPNALVSAVNRACSLRGILSDPELKRLVAHISSLPSLPTIYLELEKAVQDEATTMTVIAEIISRDIGMTAKIMQIANSAFFGLTRKINTPEEAVLLIGLKTIQALILSTHIFSQFRNPVRFQLFLDHLWVHSHNTSILAKAIIQKKINEKALHDNASTAGLLHDCGKLILADNFPDDYEQVLAFSGKERIPLWQAEEKKFGAHHGSIGAYLLGIWGLPHPIIEALAFHHHPHTFTQDDFSPLTAVHIADALEAGENDRSTENTLFKQTSLSNLPDVQHLQEWQKLARELREKKGKP